MQSASQGLDGVFLAGDWIGLEGYLANASLAGARVVARLAGADAARRSCVGFLVGLSLCSLERATAV